tara:strand:+ start:1446 stop:1646 length:201 start_codon:yes stop_codon:yes gene_type:complete
MSRILSPKMNMPTTTKTVIPLTPIGSVPDENPDAQRKRRGKKATILTSNSGLQNKDEDSYKPSLLG